MSELTTRLEAIGRSLTGVCTAVGVAAVERAALDAAARIRELEAIVEAAKALVEVRRRFVSVAWYMPEHPGNQYWIDKFMAAYTPLEQAIRAAEAAKGKA